MVVLVTRSLPGANETALRLKALGLEPLVSPVLGTEAVPFAEPDWAITQAIMVTSAAGARAAAQFSCQRSIAAFAVGDATAAVLRAGGYLNVFVGPGDAESLGASIVAQLLPFAGDVVHVRGEIVAFDPVPMLLAAGLDARSLHVYRTIAANSLTEGAVAALRAGQVRAVLFHSQEGARGFLRLVSAAKLEQTLQSVLACALSARIAATLDAQAWKDVYVAAALKEDALLALLA